MVCTRLMFPFLLSLACACGTGAQPTTVTPYDGPLPTGQENGVWPEYPARGEDGAFGGIQIVEHSYEVVVAPGIDWNSADAAARTKLRNGVPGHLATITSAEEDQLIDGIRKAVTTRELWVGGFQLPGSMEPDGGWTWINGEGSFPGTNIGPEYTNWTPPGGTNNQGRTENWLCIGFNNAYWNDENNLANVDGYLIE